MKIEVAFITHNRLDYTKLALESILADDNDDLSITIWDNGSSDGTSEYLKSGVKDRRVKQVVCSPTNVGQVTATNEVWSRSQADLLGKLDNDCLLPRGWSATLARAHADINELGAVACWPYFADDFDESRAGAKINTFGRHRIFRHPWTCGTGFLIKRRTFEQHGPVAGKAMTQYFIELALAGQINGFYYPLLFQEHMDDPKSAHCQTKTKEALEAAVNTVRAQTGLFRDPQERFRCRQAMVANLLDGPYDPAYYVGWKARVRRVKDLCLKRLWGSSRSRAPI